MKRVRILTALAMAAPACTPPEATLPMGIDDPAAVETPAGAVAVYRGALVRFRAAFNAYVRETGLLSDELQDGTALGAPSLFAAMGLDARRMPESEDAGVWGESYGNWHGLRADAGQAARLLHDFAPDVSPALRAHAYAAAGYAEVLLAETYCSGVPLSTLDYKGDYTLRPGSTTEEVMAHAIALFDTAIDLSADSARVRDLARVGRARTLLWLGRFAEAGAEAALVPDGYRYEFTFSGNIPVNTNIWAIEPSSSSAHSVADVEGVNGYPHRSSGDPRTSASAWPTTNQHGVTLYHPDKYATDGTTPLVLAGGIEARLIEAEAALRSGDRAGWLAKLNHLRQTATSTIVPAIGGPLTELDDPGDDAEGGDGRRVDLLFRERAAWLFLTGHRQGDMRRLVRQYGRHPEQVYPTGPYPAGGGTYGQDITVPIPWSERVLNPHFTGCQGRI